MPDRDQDVSLFKHLAGGAGIGGTLGGLASAVGTGIMNYGPKKAVGRHFGYEDLTLRQILGRMNPSDSAKSLRNVVSGIGIGAGLGAGAGGLAYFIEKRKREREEAEAMNRRLLEHLAVQVAEKTDMNKQASFQAFLRKTAGEEDFTPLQDAQEYGGSPEDPFGYRAGRDPNGNPMLQMQMTPEMDDETYTLLMRRMQQQNGTLPEEEDEMGGGYPDDPEKMGSYDPVRLQRIGNEKSKAPRTTSALKRQAPLPKTAPKKSGSNDAGF